MTRSDRRLTAGCLFSGMGGFATGLERAGFALNWANDNDQYAAATFRHRFPTVRFLQKDIRELSVVADKLAEVDILAGGFPCQSFSQAGSRRGFEDPRGELFFEIPRLLQEFTPERRPRLVVLENVPNLSYGADLAWFDEIRHALRGAGYWFREETCWRVNVKDVTELPQDRERLIMVAASQAHFPYNPFSPSQAASGTQNSRRRLDDFVDRRMPASADAYLAPENRYYKMIQKTMEAGESGDNLFQLRRSYVREKKQGLCPTLTANMGVGGHNVPFLRDSWGIRKLTVREVASLQGFDPDELLFPDIPMSEQYRLLGNAVCVHLARLAGQSFTRILNGAQT